jgi:predicted dehydrogenase
MLKAGIIGLGVGEQHIYGYQSHPECEVIAICDINPNKLEEVSQRHPGIYCTKDPEYILKHPDIEVVSIASYDNFHKDQIVLGLKHHKHIFVEKPICLFEDELASIYEAKKSKPNLKLSSNLILRKTDRFIELKSRISSGKMGSIYHISGDYDYGRLHKITEGWRSDIPYYSAVHGGGIHLIDLINWITGKKPVTAYATGNKISTHDSEFRHNDFIIALLEYEDGMIVKLTANLGSVTPHHHRLSVYGTLGTFEQTHLGAGYIFSRNKEDEIEKIQTPYPGAKKGDMLPNFVRSILENSMPDVTTQEVFDAMSVSLAIEKSVESNKKEIIKYYPL